MGELEILETFPPAGERDVDVETRVDLCFSGLVDPQSIDDLDLTLRTGRLVFDSQLTMQLVPWRDPGGHPARRDSPWCPGSVISLAPKVALAPGVLYRVLFRPSPVGWTGESLQTSGEGWVTPEDDTPRFTLEFTTTSEPASHDQTDEDLGPVTLSRLFEPTGPLSNERPLCGCHRGSDNGDALARRRLDLSTPTTAHRDLVVPSRTFDTGFPMVSPRRPSHSFLLHKLVRDHDGSAIFPIRGEPMPPDAAIPYADFVAIARWIEDGALR